MDNTKYREDLDSAVKILKKITLSKKESVPQKESKPGKPAIIRK
ncbi:unnamed protein product, partial [marine sediment metagenome]